MQEKNQKKSMHVIARRNSFLYAFSGIWQLFKTEPNAKLHTFATVGVLIVGGLRHLGAMQWCALCFAIGLVWITEALNTCIERLCNLWCDHKWHPEVKIIKDIAAGAVLISALVSVVIAVLVFVIN